MSGKKGGKNNFCDGDLTLLDYANSTVKKGKSMYKAKARTSFNLFSKAVASEVAEQSTAVKKGKPRKVDIEHQVKHLNIQDEALDEQLKEDDVDKNTDRQLNIQEQDWFDFDDNHKNDQMEVKKQSTEELAWDEQPDSEEDQAWDEQPDSDKDLAWAAQFDISDNNFLVFAKDDKKSGSSGTSKEVQNYVTVKKEEVEQYRLRNNLVIYGLKEKLGENTKAQVVDLCRKRLKVKIIAEDIIVAQRLGLQKPPGKHRSILVTFKNYSDRRKVYNIKRKLKSSGVVIHEHLTAQRLELYLLLREKYGDKRTWTQDGTVFWATESGCRYSATRMDDLKITNVV